MWLEGDGHILSSEDGDRQCRKGPVLPAGKAAAPMLFLGIHGGEDLKGAMWEADH